MKEEQTREAHRHFAMECNNRAWQLATQKRTSEQDAELLDCAHASAYHWGFAGNELNHMRATMLLAEVHALLGLGLTAWRYANRMHDYFLAVQETPDWELAFTHAIHAHAAWAAGEETEHAKSYAAAELAIAEIVDADDRAVVLDTFRLVPAP